MASKRELVYHNMAVMLEAGLPLGKAITTAAKGVKGRQARDLSFLNESIHRGTTLSQAMSARRRSFSRMEVMIVEAGETSGMVPQAMRSLADWYAFRARLKRDLILGMVYPVFLFHVAALLIPLPGLFTSGFDFGLYFRRVLTFLAVLYIPAVVVWVIRRLIPSTGWIRRLMDATGLMVPVLGGALLHLALARFAHVFHTLYAAGVHITRALPQAIAVCGNAQVARWLAGATRSVRAGLPASEGFGRELPRQFVHAWANGEESGMLDTVTARLARMEADGAHFRLAGLAKWTPRIVYVLIVLYIAMQVLRVAPVILSH